jgi:hypothetical protein
MTETTAFAEFIRRIRTGDDQAARDLVARYEPVIRREVRMRLRDPRLHSHFDGSDVCQSVLASFFVRAAAGQFDMGAARGVAAAAGGHRPPQGGQPGAAARRRAAGLSAAGAV